MRRGQIHGCADGRLRRLTPAVFVLLAFHGESVGRSATRQPKSRQNACAMGWGSRHLSLSRALDAGRQLISQRANEPVAPRQLLKIRTKNAVCGQADRFVKSVCEDPS